MMAYRDYTLLQRFVRWIIGVSDPDDFSDEGVENVLMDHEPPNQDVVIDYLTPEGFDPPHKIIVRPETVKPGMGMPQGSITYKLVCPNSPAMGGCPVFNFYAGQRTGQRDELVAVDMDYLAIVIDLIARRCETMSKEGVFDETKDLRNALRKLVEVQSILVADELRGTFTIPAMPDPLMDTEEN